MNIILTLLNIINAMRNTLLTFFAFLTASACTAQGMSPQKLKTIVAEVADTLQNTGNAFQFLYEKKLIICVYDEKADRMRLISPIIEREELEEEQLLNALVANFNHVFLQIGKFTRQFPSQDFKIDEPGNRSHGWY